MSSQGEALFSTKISPAIWSNKGYNVRGFRLQAGKYKTFKRADLIPDTVITVVTTRVSMEVIVTS